MFSKETEVDLRKEFFGGGFSDVSALILEAIESAETTQVSEGQEETKQQVQSLLNQAYEVARTIYGE